MRSWLTYTVARLVLFAAAFGVVYLFGARSWIALILAWVVSGLASYVLLSKWRDQISQQIVELNEARRGARLGDRLEGGATREDHLQDAAEEAQGSQEETAEGPHSAQEEPTEGEAGPEEGQEPATAADGDESPKAEIKDS